MPILSLRGLVILCYCFQGPLVASVDRPGDSILGGRFRIGTFSILQPTCLQHHQEKAKRLSVRLNTPLEKQKRAGTTQRTLRYIQFLYSTSFLSFFFFTPHKLSAFTEAKRTQRLSARSCVSLIPFSFSSQTPHQSDFSLQSKMPPQQRVIDGWPDHWYDN